MAETTLTKESIYLGLVHSFSGLAHYHYDGDCGHRQTAAESFTSGSKGNKERDRDTRPGMGV